MKYTFGQMKSPWIQEDPSCWGALFDGARERALSKGEVLFYEGSMPKAVYLVDKGRLCLRATHHSGNEKQLYIAERGAVCGEAAAIGSTPCSSTGTAIVNSVVQELSVPMFLKRLEESPELTRLMLEYEVRKRTMFESQMISLANDSATTRIIQTLLDLSYIYGRQTPQGCSIDVRFTKNEIAGMVGTSRVTASNVLGKLEDGGYLKRKGANYVIVDMNRLVSLTPGA